MKRHSRKTNQMECRNQNLGWEREQELKREQEFKKYKRRIICKLIINSLLSLFLGFLFAALFRIITGNVQ